MSEHVFQSLLGTGSSRPVPGAGSDGGSGFRFEAVSAGVDDEMKNVVRRCASESHASSGEGGHSTSEHVPELTHVFDGVYVTARGVPAKDAGTRSEAHPGTATGETGTTGETGEYGENEGGATGELGQVGSTGEGGRTAAAGRAPEGAEDPAAGGVFTRAIATRDPRSYGPVRPAQLWDAPWWSDVAPPRDECSPVLAEPEPGCDVDEIRDWVLTRWEGERWLLALASALRRVRDRGAERIVLIGAEPGELARWLAAGTLLLPQKSALRIGFRLFAADPRRDEHDVLALPPEWSGKVAHDGEFLVFDFVEQRLPEVAVDEDVAHWAPRFLSSDPFHVVDAVELARQFARNDDRDRAERGDRLASSVLVLEEPAGDRAGELADWLASAPAESAREARSQVVEAVLSAGPDARALRALVGGAGTDALAGQVRYALLWAEIDEISRGGAGDSAPALPEREWSPSEREQATALVEGVAATLPPQRLDPLLRVATRFGLAPSPGRMGEVVSRFVTWWLDHPDADVAPARWSCATEVLDLVRDEVSARLERADADETIGEVRQRWWPILLPTISDPFMALDALVASSAVDSGGSERAAAIGALRGHLQDPASPETAEAVWSALFEFADPTMEEALEFLSAASVVTKALAQRVFALLETSTVSAAYLDVLRKLVEHNRTPEQESMLSMWQEDGKLRFWLNGFRKRADGADADKLREVSDRVLAARSGEILEVLLAADLQVAAEVAERGGEHLPTMLARELPAVWSGYEQQQADKAVALAFHTACSDAASTELRSQVDPQLEQWARSGGSAEHRRIHRMLRSVDPESATIWQEWLRELPRAEGSPKPRSRGIFGRFRRRS